MFLLTNAKSLGIKCTQNKKNAHKKKWIRMYGGHFFYWAIVTKNIIAPDFKKKSIILSNKICGQVFLKKH